MQVCGDDIVNALSSTPTRLYADTWHVCRYILCRYIRQTVSICHLLRTPPQIGNGLFRRSLGFALARAPLQLGRALWLCDSARWALWLLPLVDLGWVHDLSGVISAQPLGVNALDTNPIHLMAGKRVVGIYLGRGSRQGLVPWPCSCCWS